MYLAWTCTTPYKLAYSLHTCSFLLSPWIGPEVPSEAITLARRWMGGERYGKSLGVNCRKKINKLLVKLFKLALRAANDHTKHAHTQALYLLHVPTQPNLSFAVHKIATVSLQTE